MVTGNIIKCSEAEEKKIEEDKKFLSLKKENKMLMKLINRKRKRKKCRKSKSIRKKRKCMRLRKTKSRERKKRYRKSSKNNLLKASYE